MENTQAPKPSEMFGRCMTDSLCRGMPLMIVVLNSATHTQPGHHLFCSTAAEGQAARLRHSWRWSRQVVSTIFEPWMETWWQAAVMSWPPCGRTAY